jgi:putative FmdB family regulatory protein
MPTYNYVCELCGARFEKNVRFSDNPNQAECPNGHAQTRRVFTAPAVVFKGKGFYITDSRKPSKDAAND